MASQEHIDEVAAFELRVGPYTYTVDSDPQAAYDYDFYGVTYYKSKRIGIDERQADTELPQTLLHEVLHALGHAYEIPEWMSHKHDDNGHVTDKLDLMASAILQFMRNNSDVVEYLMKDR